VTQPVDVAQPAAQPHPRPTRSLAEICFDLADGDPELSLWLGVRATQLEAGYERERKRAFRPPLSDALRLLAERKTAELLDWPALTKTG
jgi:hypothetical protein